MGGLGTRLLPLTTVTSKQLLPLYNKSIVAYPLRTLQDMDIEDVLIINASLDQQLMTKNYLGDGSKFGMKFTYAIQDHPNGLPEAFLIADRLKFLNEGEDVVLILGDNIFINHSKIIPKDNTIYTYKVKNPSAYGVVTTNEDGTINQLIEKPKEFISDQAVVGLYSFDYSVIEKAKTLKPSARGELEIVDLIKLMDNVHVESLDGFWFDVGTFDDLLDCANLVRTITHRTSEELGILNK